MDLWNMRTGKNDTWTFDDAKTIEDELDRFFREDADIAELLESPRYTPPMEPETFSPVSLDDLMRSFSPEWKTPISETNSFSQPSVTETSAPKSSVVDTVTQLYPELFDDPQLNGAKQKLPEHVSDKKPKMSLKHPEQLSVLQGNKAEQKEPAITEQQLRALSKKHLLMMISDLEKELKQAKNELENLLIAYQAGLSQESQRCRVG